MLPVALTMPPVVTLPPLTLPVPMLTVVPEALSVAPPNLIVLPDRYKSLQAAVAPPRSYVTLAVGSKLPLMAKLPAGPLLNAGLDMSTQ